MTRTLAFAFAFALVVGTGAAHAQAAATVSIAPNADVRATLVRGPERRMGGQFVRLSHDTLVLSRRRVTLALPMAEVQRLEVRGGRAPWRGARWGAGLLGGIAVLFGGVDVARGGLEAGEYAGTIVGNALIGGLLGYAIAPRGWTDVPLPAAGSQPPD